MDDTFREQGSSFRRRTNCDQRVKRRTIRSHRQNYEGGTRPTSTPSKNGKRPREPPSPTTNVITRLSTLHVPTSLSKVWISQTSVSILVDYLLYTRGLFPLTVAEVVKSQERTSESDSVSSTMQRKLKAANNQRGLFMEAWNAHSTRHLLQGASCALITIGPSYGSGIESYLLDLRNLLTSNPPESISDGPPTSAVARKLLPKIMEADLSLPRSNMASCRLFVSLLVSEDSAQVHWNEITVASESSHLPSTRWLLRSGRVLPTFQDLQPKTGGRTPKQRLVVLSLRHGSRSTSPEGSSVEAMTDDRAVLESFQSVSDGGGPWVCLPYAIKGFRGPR